MMGLNSGWYESGFKFFCQNSSSQLISSHIQDSLVNPGWMHIAVTMDSGSYAVLINGIILESRNYSDSPAFQDGMLAQVFQSGIPDWYIGWQDHPDNHRFQGAIDDFFIFSSRLELRELRDLMRNSTQSSSLKDPSLVIFEDFDHPDTFASPQNSGAPHIVFAEPPRLEVQDRPLSVSELKTGLVPVLFTLPPELMPHATDRDLRVRLMVDGTENPDRVRFNSQGICRMLLGVDRSQFSLLVEYGNDIYGATVKPGLIMDREVLLDKWGSGPRVQLLAMPEVDGLDRQWAASIRAAFNHNPDVSTPDHPRVMDLQLLSDSNGRFEEIVIPEGATVQIHTFAGAVEVSLPADAWDKKSITVPIDIPFRKLHYTTFENFARKDGLHSKDTDHLYLDEEGTLWVTHFEQGLNYLSDGSFHSVPSLLWKEVRSVSSSPVGPETFAGTEDGLYVLTRGRSETDGRILWQLSRNPQHELLMKHFQGSRVMVLKNDGAARIWIASSTGLSCLHPDGTLSGPYSFSNVLLDDINSIIQLEDGAVLINSWAFGPLVSEAIGNRIHFRPFEPASSYFRGHSIRSVCQTPDGRIWFGADHGFFVLNPASGAITRLWNLPVETVAGINLGRSSVNDRPADEDSSAVAVLSESGKIRIHHNGLWKFIGDHLSGFIEKAVDMVADPRGNIWVSSPHQGVIRITPQNSFLPVTTSTSRPDRLPAGREAVRALDTDAYGNTWFVDNARALRVIGDNKQLVSDDLLQGFIVSPEIGDINAGCFNPVDGAFWVGGSHGLLHIEPSGSRRLFINENWVYPPDINGIDPGENGNMWVSTHGGGIVQTGRDGQVIRRIPMETDNESRFTNCVLNLNDGRCLIGTHGGLFILNGYDENPEFIPLHPRELTDSDIVPAPQGFMVSAMALSPDHSQVLVGTAHGLYSINLTRPGLEAVLEHSLPDLFILSVHHWIDSRYLVGTDGDYLHVWDQEKKIFNEIGPDYGVTGDTVTHVVLDEPGTIWLGMNTGAVCLVPDIYSTPPPGLTLHYGGRMHPVQQGATSGTISTPEKIFFSFADSDHLADVVDKFKYQVYLEAAGRSRRMVQMGTYVSQGIPVELLRKDGKYVVEVTGFDPFLNPSARAVHSFVRKTPFLNSGMLLWFFLLCSITGTSLILVLISRQHRLGRAVESERKANMERLRTKNRELSEAIQKANQAAEAKSRFLACMSHEIRTPMNGILGMAEVLGHTPLTAEQMDYRNTIAKCAQCLLRIINDILDFSKLEAGKLRVENTRFSLPALIDEVLNLHRIPASRNGVELSCRTGPGIPAEVLGDSLRIKQILDNLLGNAIKFAPHGQVSLNVEARSMEQENRFRIVFSVSDTGIGIPAEKIADIYNAFDQVDVSTTRKYGGTGLGLAITRDLVELLGGDISVDSKVGHGSTFTVRIPMESTGADEADSACLTRVVNSLGAESGGPVLVRSTEDPGVEETVVTRLDLPVHPQILVVEDNAVNQKLMIRMINRLGFNADVVANGLDAVEALSDPCTPYRLVFMDCHMPVMDGIAASQEIRKIHPQEAGTVHIVALTANSFESDRKICLEAGMDDFISKPVSMGRIRELLETCPPLMRPEHKE